MLVGVATAIGYFVAACALLVILGAFIGVMILLSFLADWFSNIGSDSDEQG